MGRRTRAGVVAAGMMAGGMGSAAAQEVTTVRPGDGVVDGSFLQPYAAEFALERQGADGEVLPFGRWTDTLRVGEWDGRRALERVVARFTGEDVKDLWRQHLVEPGSLRPWRTLQRMGPDLAQSMDLVFRNDSIHAHVVGVGGAGEQRLSTTPSEPVYDLALYATLLVAFPLKVGYAARFPIYGPTLDLAWETMRVTGRESVEIEDGRTVDAFVVSTETRTWTAWLTREPPYIARIVQRFPDGSVVTSTRTSWSRLPG